MLHRNNLSTLIIIMVKCCGCQMAIAQKIVVVYVIGVYVYGHLVNQSLVLIPLLSYSINLHENIQWWKCCASWCVCLGFLFGDALVFFLFFRYFIDLTECVPSSFLCVLFIHSLICCDRIFTILCLGRWEHKRFTRRKICVIYTYTIHL